MQKILNEYKKNIKMNIIIFYLKKQTNMKKIYLFFAVLLIITQAAFAQNDTVVGILLDVNNKVIKKHPVTLGRVLPITTKTDKNGIFVFANANLQDTLYVGNKKGKNAIAIPLYGNSVVSIKSKKGDFTSEYGSDELEQVRRDIRQLQNDRSTSLNTVRSEDIEDSQCKNIECLIGRMTGVSINAGNVRIGGTVSIYSSNNALIVLDGVDVGYSLNAVNFLHPNEINNITVSRDGSMYGVRGAAGVLVVNTK